MKKVLTGVITKEDKYYVARCLEVDIVSQGITIQDAKYNLKEATELYLESYDQDELEELPDKEKESILYNFDVEVKNV
ncbi:type II toxin-antitoxin system HicB family antitoxin [Candidatus Pacearchaeota archaeon]|jgi:predicted RNase H-like HicB family nuclease|nr:type II toxin-antitoxin system HicB family antitoxin [Candidatus Pacearchaeota archaeon]